MKEIHPCSTCGSEDVSRNGHTRHGKQNYKCRDCRRQFVLNPQWQTLSEEQKGLTDRYRADPTDIEQFNCTLRQRVSRLVLPNG